MAEEVAARYTKIVKGIGYTVGETTVDKQRNAKEQRQIVALASKGNYRCHYETTTDGKYSTKERTCMETRLEYALGSFLNGHRAATSYERNGKTTNDVAKKNEEKLEELTFLEETCCTCIEFEAITNYGKKSEGEAYGTYYTFLGKVSKTC